MAAAGATFDGIPLHKDPYQLAAAYAVYLIQGHPFVDGNKRVGAASALALLRINRLPVAIEEDAMHRAGLDISAGILGIGGLARMLRP